MGQIIGLPADEPKKSAFSQILEGILPALEAYMKTKSWKQSYGAGEKKLAMQDKLLKWFEDQGKTTTPEQGGDLATTLQGLLASGQWDQMIQTLLSDPKLADQIRQALATSGAGPIRLPQ